ncbi:phosphatidylinositol 4-phosphate 5-kinase-like protein 1 isoform X1 [Misgurnus anguillicaudatus]|uniref:phosphatidylinositol 4-phosphate 5-kinase-like protein 1 isoform X1 n=1 Tax=Misgurnus anguillicaudatus TaxID=75329 RepID=UPI003CCF9E37
MSQQRRTSSTRRRKWSGLITRWTLLGLFEIDEGHEFYDLTCMMKSGISTALQNNINEPTPTQLSPDDFTKEETDIHQGFMLQTFAGPVFANLRRSVHISEEEYENSVASSEPYLQFISNSKSKADFFITHDRRFFLKTETKKEIGLLLSNLRIYTEHLHKYPHSLLVKILGVHRIIISGESKKYFIVMQSVFYPDERVTARYDIKGCEVGRWSNPTPKKNQAVVILKDMNFEGQHIVLGEQRSWLVRQVKIDTAFLRSINVLDYSLLLAHQPLHEDELDQNHHLANLVHRTTISLNQKDPTHPCSVSRCSSDRDSCLIMPDNNSEHKRSEETLHFQDFEQTQVENRRLLPDYRNPLHVIDGPQLRYFVGIIDIFTEYGFQKKLENLWKRIKYPRRAFSTVSPSAYSLRFNQWVEGHTK